VIGVHNKAVSSWLVEADEKLQESCSEAQAYSFIEDDELCSFIGKKIQMLDLGSP